MPHREESREQENSGSIDELGQCAGELGKEEPLWRCLPSPIEWGILSLRVFTALLGLYFFLYTYTLSPATELTHPHILALYRHRDSRTSPSRCPIVRSFLSIRPSIYSLPNHFGIVCQCVFFVLFFLAIHR